MKIETKLDEQPAQKQIGRSLNRLEARSKVTGRADYIHNLVLPRMLHGKILRSTVAHGKITGIDTSAARELPGVFGVYTAQDIVKVIPEPYYGPAFHDQPILALEKVRYIGEPVAVVLATDPHIAEEATHLIMVDYEDMPAVFDEVQAAQSDDVLVHEFLRPAGTFPDLQHLAGRKGTNVALDYRLRRGDVEAAFASAAHVFEDTFRTQQVMHTPLEPMVSVAEPDAGMGTLTVHTASQSPSFVRIEIARLLGWDENRVRVKSALLGGGFGAKLYIKVEALVVALALLAKRPVKVSLTMEEQFFTITKHATTFRMKTAVSADGRITGRKCEVWWNGGAYADIGPRVTQKSGFTATGPYEIENVSIDSYQVYTNLPPAGAFRGFGIPQMVWAYESHADMIARALQIDPVEFRRRNLLREGRMHPTGTTMHDAAVELVLERVADRMNWNAPFERGTGTLRRGRGIGVGFKALVAPTTSMAMISLAGDGSCTVYSSTVDMGQASETAIALMAGEVLGIPAERIKVMRPDTDVTPYDMATLGSRSTFHMGHAVRLAAEDVNRKIAELAEELGVPSVPAMRAGELLRRKYKMQAGNIVGIGSFIPNYESPSHETGQSENITPNWMVGGCGVEVEVDTETGHFRLLRFENVVDCGTPINPKVVDTQISGAAIMQLGITLFERMEFDEAGQLRNASFAEYKIPGIHDIPAKIGRETVESVQNNGPFGAKGVGESSTFGVASAIAEAIEDAVGVRLTSLPLTPESVYRALCAARNEPLAEE
ncbi:xanthine dehydrogenase family protein molybdopterin-binding subunit [Paraburkholderia sp. SOS3]|jgi:CO/xanthine dehydrogenase Mo-binding subunit|uniref:xanthine dehydrogenase family protein molybdopterin-binding subunit n=1 Tax=Paraburkholderia sp. SOS3 TaxID=1926494 RepID=UPI0009477EEC|nr:xanthine dehydrogenase family protein molybdopterin-binding subunit [Paraburkholderia sp. SOS3]APR39545.1 aldehyde oxidase [Paraburkholderia sp. SOS3]